MVLPWAQLHPVALQGFVLRASQLLKSDNQAFQMGVARASPWASQWRAMLLSAMVTTRGVAFGCSPSLYRVFDTSACKFPTNILDPGVS